MRQRFRFHFRLRTLLIAAAVLPPAIALLTVYLPRVFHLGGRTTVPVAVVVGTILFMIVYNSVTLAECNPSERWRSFLRRKGPNSDPLAAAREAARAKERQSVRKQIAQILERDDQD